MFSVPQPQLLFRSRAQLIAVTESGAAYEQGNRALVDQLAAAGLQMEKSWLDVGDSRVSDGCQTNAAADWIPVEDTFPAGADQPPLHPACRCTALYRRVPSAVGVPA